MSKNTSNPQAKADLKGETEEGKVRILISAYKPCTITNAEGETLVYDGDEYDGDMKVYDVMQVGESDLLLYITTDKSASFKVSGYSGPMDFGAEVSDQAYITDVTKSREITISKTEGIRIRSDQPYEYKLVVGGENPLSDYAEVTGKSSGSIRFSLENDSFNLSAEKGSTDVRILCIDEEGKESKEDCGHVESSVSIAMSADGITAEKKKEESSGTTKNPGSYKVTVTLKGNYTGKKTVSFTILPKGTRLLKVSAGKKKITVKWKKPGRQTGGCQIQYSLRKNFKNAKKRNIKGTKKTSAVIKRLKAGKKYYVRIRTYKKVGKKMYYSSWSKAKTVKVKK